MPRQNAASPHVGFCVFCGLLLLLGFFIPVAQPNLEGDGLEMVFINIEGLQEITVPTALSSFSPIRRSPPSVPSS